MRDQTHLRAFQLIDGVTRLVDQLTTGCPREEMHGLVPSLVSPQSPA